MYLIIYGFLKICDNRENTVRQINILKAEAQADVQTQEALNVLRLPCGLPCVSLEEWSLEGLVNITRPDSIYLALSFSKYLLSNCKVSGKVRNLCSLAHQSEEIPRKTTPKRERLSGLRVSIQTDLCFFLGLW